MPSHLPSSFASAAAGSSRDTRNGRGDGRGSGDWYVASLSTPERFILSFAQVDIGRHYFKSFVFGQSLPTDLLFYAVRCTPEIFSKFVDDKPFLPFSRFPENKA